MIKLLLIASLGIFPIFHASLLKERIVAHAAKVHSSYPMVGGMAWLDEKGNIRSLFEPLVFISLGACDSEEECTDETDTMCEQAGHIGVDETTVEITEHVNDDGQTCSGDCADGSGAVAIIDCRTNIIGGKECTSIQFGSI